MVIFDSTVPEGEARAVYVEALAEEVGETVREEGIAIVSRRYQAVGAAPWDVEDVAAPAPHRLYRARASRHFVLDPHDRRIPVQLP